MSNSGNKLITARQFAVLWFATGITMTVFTVGWVLNWWDTDHLLWSVALLLLIVMGALSTAEYYFSEVRPS